MITADEVVDDIAKGVREALRTSVFLLGAEAIDFNYPKIRPEYLVTVEVAKRMGRMDRVIGLETHMDKLKTNAKHKAILLANTKFSKYIKSEQERNLLNQQRTDRISEINRIVSDEKYQFSPGGSGKKRVDIVVFTSDLSDIPLLISEAKLGSQTAGAIIADIDRVLTLLQMHRDLGFEENIYGAVFFYRMLPGKSISDVRADAKNLLSRINSHLSNKKDLAENTWLKAKADLLTRESYAEPIQGYEEHYENGSQDMVFTREGFAFTPGLILLGQADDVETVSF